MGYTLAAKFASEAVGMCFTIFMGESIIANELLPSTKGHAMGILGVAIGFGFAFGCSIAWFGGISAHLNPGMFFFLAILDKLEYGWAEFAVCSLANILGAFFGAVLVYLFYAVHFWTVPLPQDKDPVSNLIHGNPDALSDDAARIASAFGKASRRPTNTSIRGEIYDLGSKFRGGRQVGSEKMSVIEEEKNGDALSDREKARKDELNIMISKMEVRRRKQAYDTDPTFYSPPGKRSSERLQINRSNSIQVAELGRKHDPQLELDDDDLSRHSVQVAALLHRHDPDVIEECKTQNEETTSSTIEVKFTSNSKSSVLSDDADENGTGKGLKEKERTIREVAYLAAIDADAHAKLSIFATRPAKYNRAANFCQEMLASAVLFFGAEMFNLRKEFDPSIADADGPFSQALFVSLFIMMLILGLGGTTGLAVNPARDFGPRLAHTVLPIPGKGNSEWHYGWVPFFAPFVGAALGAVIYRSIEVLYESGATEE